MSNAPNRTIPSGDQAKGKRSPVERLIVWGGILVLLSVVGVESYAKYGYTTASEALNRELSEGDAKTQVGHLTDVDVKRILGGKQPEFAGKISQLKIPARTYEVYVWRGLLKRNWNPPESREDIDIHAAYSGQVRPDLLPENIQKIRQNPTSREVPNFFSAYTLYVYYSVEDRTSKVREVVSVRDSREPYQYEEVLEPYVYLSTLPTDEGLAIRHKNVMEQHKAGMGKRGEAITPESLDRIDPWKNPPPEYLKNIGPSIKSSPSGKSTR